MPHYDLVIVGAGSGNMIVNRRFADWRVAIVESGRFGGTCLNVGCIPTKMYVYPADLAATADDWPRLGLAGTAPRADWPRIRDRIFGRIDPLAAAAREQRVERSPNVTVYETSARFTGPQTLRLDSGETLTAEHVVLATGTRPIVPEVIAASGVTFHTSDTIMRLEHLPERLVILGGGFVAAEFAHVFTAFGVPVTVVTRHDLLRHHDRDVRTRLTDLVRDRWDLRTGATVTSATEHDGEVRLGLDGGTEVGGDVLLVATGRTPNSDRLDLAAGGVLTHPDGRIVVDEYQRTTAAGVWALGDASTEHRLKHVANHEARTVAHNLLHPDDPIASDHRFVPGAVFTHPQIATVGATEDELVETGRRYVGAVVGYDQIAGGWAMEDTTGFCKLLADPESGRLLGAHLMGPQASILIQPLIQAMSFGLGVREMARGQYWIHPALTEVVENALLALHLS